MTKLKGQVREYVRVRPAEGIAIANCNGGPDRVPKLTTEQIIEAPQRADSGPSKTRVARDFGVSRQTVYTALSGTGKYAELAEAASV